VRYGRVRRVIVVVRASNDGGWWRWQCGGQPSESEMTHESQAMNTQGSKKYLQWARLQGTAEEQKWGKLDCGLDKKGMRGSQKREGRHQKWKCPHNPMAWDRKW
jgi:hypothetical protein